MISMYNRNAKIRTKNAVDQTVMQTKQKLKQNVSEYTCFSSYIYIMCKNTKK